MLHAEVDPDAADMHPFWYARVIGIYHVDVRDLSNPLGNPYQRMDILFVRWMGINPDWMSGWDARRLDQIGFLPQDNEGAFGFLDPLKVLRGCHLIPAFAIGTTTQLLEPSPLARQHLQTDALLARTPGTSNADWDLFYVNRYVSSMVVLQLN